MSKALTDFHAAVVRMIQDDAGFLTQAEIEGIIQDETAELYSRHRPYERTADLTANGAYDYEINATNFPGWLEGFSKITDVEYPAGDYQEPNMQPREDWRRYDTPTTGYLRFKKISPSSGTIRCTYIRPHSIPDSGASTIYENDFGAVCSLAAAFCCGALARRYAQTSDSTIGADAVAYRDKSDVYASRMKELYKNYMDYIFPDKVDAAAAMKEFDTTYVFGWSRLTHPDWGR